MSTDISARTCPFCRVIVPYNSGYKFNSKMEVLCLNCGKKLFSPFGVYKYWGFLCPLSRKLHYVFGEGWWDFNEDFKKPTFSPKDLNEVKGEYGRLRSKEMCAKHKQDEEGCVFIKVQNGIIITSDESEYEMIPLDDDGNVVCYYWH